MKGNIPIPELINDVQVWLPVTVSSIYRGVTRQGKRYYDAVALNSTGRISLKCWQGVIEKYGELRPGLALIIGSLSHYQHERQFVVRAYRSISVDQYRNYQKCAPILPQAYTVDIETLPLEQYKERVQVLHQRQLQSSLLQIPNVNTVLEGEDSRYVAGALSAATGRILSIAVQIAPKAEFSQLDVSPTEYIFGITQDGEEHPEKETLKGFLDLMTRFDPETDEIVTHNGLDFDLPFIFQRCVVHSLPVPPLIQLGSYNVHGVYDTCRAWFGGARHRCSISLDALAWALGFESSKSDELRGDNILALYNSGRLLDIREYNLCDVRLTRRIYERLVLFMGR